MRNGLDAKKDNFIKVSLKKNVGLNWIKRSIDEIGRFYENIDKKYRIIDKEIEGVIKRLERMMKSKKKPITDEKRDYISKVMDAVKALQEIVSNGTKTTLTTLNKIVELTRVSIAPENGKKIA